MNLDAGSQRRRIPTAEGAVLRFFRFSRGLNEKELALLAGVDVATVRRWENGGAPLSRDWLADFLNDLLGIPPEAVDEALAAHRRATEREALEGPYALSEAEHRLLGRASVAAGQAGAEMARRELALDRLRNRAARDTAWAKEKWARLKKLPADQQAKVLRGLRGSERSWALARQLGEASTAAAADSAAEALRLARCCMDLARESPGTERWRLRLLGACEPYEGNALRVGGDFPATREAFVRADEHWDQGAGGDAAGLLDANRRLDLKASFLQHDGRVEEALLLLEQVLQEVRTDQERGHLLIKKATCRRIAGEYGAAIATLRQAEPLITGERGARLAFLYHFSMSLNFCHLEDFKAAEALLPLVETLAAELRTKLDERRTLWLRARTGAGLGRKEEALAAFTRVRQYFYIEKIAYDYALVSLELATLHLEQGCTRLAKELAEELRWIFESQQVHEEALAALALFQHAARMEEAHADWTRRLVKYLYRAQYNPKLRFEG